MLYALSSHTSIIPDSKITCHAKLLKLPYIRLWYLCKLNDPQGRGIVALPFSLVKAALKCASSTLYQWLRLGIVDKAFLYYKRRGDTLYIRYGSRNRLCAHLGLTNWGATVRLEWGEIDTLADARATATAITIQKRQAASHYAAWRCLKSNERKIISLPDPTNIFEKEERLLDNGRRTPKISFLLHVSKRKIFVSKGFIPFGTNQKSAANELEISTRTINRHCDFLGVDRRQLVQAKAKYRSIMQAYGGGGRLADSDNIPLFEQEGRTSHVSRLQVNGDRFFKYGGKVWLSRCNLYNLNYELTSSKTARSKYKSYLSKINGASSEGKTLNKLISRQLEKDSSCPF